MSSRKVMLFIATSLDGYIATNDDNLDFLSQVEKKDEDYGYSEFVSTIDTVIIGRKTYDWVVKNAISLYDDQKVYVITRTPRPSINNITFYAGNLKDLVKGLQAQEGKNIYCDGGAEIVGYSGPC